MAYTITWEAIADGYICWSGPLKVAVMGTSHNQGLMRNGKILYEGLPRIDWALHFTHPVVRIDLLEAILKTIPKDAVVTKA